MTELKLFNSLTRRLETFMPVHENEARVYTCGPTVYNYPHIGNMRAYVFADTLGRVLSYKGYALKHVINITDVGHLTDDGDAGEDKLEKMAAEKAQSIWDIAKHYTQAYWDDIKALNIRQPAHWSIATDYVPAMIEYAKGIADKHCYELDSGLYFDTSTVADYGRLARDDIFMVALAEITSELRKSANSSPQVPNRISVATSKLISTLRNQIQNKALSRYLALLEIWEPLENLNDQTLLHDLPDALKKTSFLVHARRIEAVVGKRNDNDFAIWRKTPVGETRQMEWDSPWGKGAPGWHLECSVMSEALLGLPFDIHTGGIDHREIHHPNEIAQNQAHSGCDHSGARVWMHNNFLIDRTGKMSKSSGEFLRLQLLIDKGFHPLAYRLMCLQAHYRSELEFSWEGLQAAFVRLKRMVMGWEKMPITAGKQATYDALTKTLEDNYRGLFEARVTYDLNTPEALSAFEGLIFDQKIDYVYKQATLPVMDAVLGLNLLTLTRADLRIRPKAALITEAEIETALAARKEARAAKDFAKSDAIRDDLIAKGVEVMDGDPLGWDWKLDV
jgi:cysteinyl-tRNA synthetase